jgi:hypothetical protein
MLAVPPINVISVEAMLKISSVDGAKVKMVLYGNNLAGSPMNWFSVAG